MYSECSYIVKFMEPVRLNSAGLFLAGPCPDGPGYVSDEFLSFSLNLII